MPRCSTAMGHPVPLLNMAMTLALNSGYKIWQPPPRSSQLCGFEPRSGFLSFILPVPMTRRVHLSELENRRG